MPFSGRILKISSLSSSMCAARFNYHLGEIGRRQIPGTDEKEQVSTVSLFLLRSVLSKLCFQEVLILMEEHLTCLDLMNVW